ncbi:MAG: Ketol-acid reductoisomerase (NAD(P)(+)) [Methanonatronarchaeales archaeon]|nr:Ketol-acid reductoisomerase (NAD(P)(+)) [Methanonatronarchaeales archaeon]
MVNMFYEEDADPAFLEGSRIAVVGYGSQGRAQSLNLRDSGLDVVVGLREGPSWERAVSEGMDVLPTEEAAAGADVVVMLIPDEAQPGVYEDQVAPNLEEGDGLAFSHGFNVHFNQIVPPEYVDVFMVAPKSPGDLVRQTYDEGAGVPGLVAVEQDATGGALDRALAYARGIGCTRAGVIETTFAEETETDLFGEQVDLCGGVTSLIKASFETMVDAGYQPEVAYFESLHELKLIVDLVHRRGLAGMWDNVSNTAEYGGLTRGDRVVGEESRAAMEDVLDEVRSGEFAREFVLENRASRPSLGALRRREADHPVERVGARLRDMMDWL